MKKTSLEYSSSSTQVKIIDTCGSPANNFGKSVPFFLFFLWLAEGQLSTILLSTTQLCSFCNIFNFLNYGYFLLFTLNRCKFSHYLELLTVSLQNGFEHRNMNYYNLWFPLVAAGQHSTSEYYLSRVMTKRFIESTFRSRTTGEVISFNDINTLDHVWQVIIILLPN